MATDFDFDSLNLAEDTEDEAPLLEQHLIDGVKRRIRDLDGFPMEETRTRNIIMLGRTGSGKSTACSVLKDICAKPGAKSLFSETVDPRFTSFSLDDKEASVKYTLNVIDTPGVQEVKPKGESQRSDAAILDTVKYCLKNEITKIHVLFIFAAFEQKITPLDKDAFRIYLDMFYNENVHIAFCITRAEGRGAAWRKSVEADLMQDEFFSDVMEKKNVSVFFCGCIEDKTIRQAHDPKTLFKSYNEIVNSRKKMIEYIFKAGDEGVSLLKLPIVSQTKHKVEEIFEKQEKILTKLEGLNELETGPIHNEVDVFAQNTVYMMENEGMFSDGELFARFVRMKGRMKVIAPRMKEDMRAKFIGNVVL